jgi:hypothetical protein
VLPVVTVPGAAASLVGSAARDPLVTAPAVALGVPEPVPESGLALEAVPTLWPDVAPTVGLVFADGDSVELADDDPRVRTFGAAAAALLEQPAS